MRIAALDLARYGPFSDVRLDFSEPAPGLHVVYGTNEAGKSTTLRALRGLLFGIPVRTADAHRHAMKDLRIGGTLVRKSGASIDVVRRKGRKDTLLDPTGSALSEDALEPFLCGMTAALFESAFGLDHVSLRTGAEAMLAGGGDVGESLFGASVGGVGIHRLRVQLSDEADALYTSRGRGRKLIVQQMTRVVEQRRALELASSGAEGYERQKRSLEEAVASRQHLRSHHAELAAEQSRLLRTLKVLPHLGRRQSLLDQLAAFGPLPDLPPDARQARVSALLERDEAAREAARLGDVIAELDARLAQLEIPEALLALDEEIVRDVDARLGRHRAAVADLPKVRAKLAAAEEDVDKALRAVRPGLDRQRARDMRPGAAVVARVRALAGRHGRLVAEADQARTAVTVLEARRDVLARRQAELPTARDVGALVETVRRLEAEGDVEARLDEAERRLRATSRRMHSTLGALGSGADETLVRKLQPPLPETLERFERELGELEVRQRRSLDLDTQLRGRLADARQRLEALTLEGEVATEAQLEDARRLRDASIAELRQVADVGDRAQVAQVDRMDGLVAQADTVADRLRREADRTARLVALTAEQRSCEARLAECEQERAELAAARERLSVGWRDEWAELPWEPRPPAEMRSWLTRLAEGRRIVEELDGHTEEVSLLRRRVEERQSLVTAELRAVGLPSSGGVAGGLAALERVVADEQQLRAQRRATEETLASLAEEHALAVRHGDAREAARAAWLERWSEAMAEVGLSGATEPEEALGVLDALAELFARIDAADTYRRRIAGMERDSADLARDVRRLCEQHLGGESFEDPAEAARALVRRHEQALTDRRTRAALREQRATAARDRGVLERRFHEAEDRLAAMCRAAGAADPTELEILERKSESARALERQLAEVEAELLAAGAGSSIAALVEETRGTRVDEAAARLNEIESELSDLVDELDQAAQEVATRSQGVARLGGSDAAAAAVELQHRVASLDAQVRRYLGIRLAAAVLDREIEQFRRAHQGPVLERAAEYFPRLTLGRYVDLRVGYDDDDHASLRCVLADGASVGVDALSDGTRDQLYLALRLATLAAHTERSEPMPFVLDDALVHFDDDRAAQALAVLGEVAERCQILFFTHHARLVEIAERVVVAERLRVHRLPAAPAVAARERRA